MREIEFAVKLKANRPLPQIGRPQEINAGDTAELSFRIVDMTAEELADSTAEITLAMHDGSLIKAKDVAQNGNVFFCILKTAETDHTGIVKTSVAVHFEDEKITSQAYEFDIKPTLEGKVAQEVVIPELTAVKEGIKESELQLKDTVTTALGGIKATELQLKNSVIANNEVVDMLLRHTLTITDDYGQDWEITVDTDGTLKTIKKGVI